MFFLNNINAKSVKSKSRSKNLFSSSAAAVLTSVAFMTVAQTANAQVVVDVTDCAELESGTFDNPASGMGATVNIDVSDTCTLTSGDIIDLENDQQDDVTINIASGTTLINTDTSDEDVVIFIDNSEDRTTINIAAGASLRGANGVIFVEGDRADIFNDGDIIGTGAAEEGVVYFDRDTDSDRNRIVNTGRILAENNGPAIGIETLIADSFDDAEDLGVQQALADFPTFRIINSGLIQTTGTASDDNDAINIAGAPGETGGFDRTCLEGAAVNCNVNIRIINTGTIRSVFDNSGVAGITFEDDAVFNGSILNNVGGIITGTRNGIRIGDVADGTLTAEHNGLIRNRGTISGTADSSRGIDLEGDGIVINNTASGTISGSSIGIEVGAGSSSDIEHSGLNNRIINSGTISGSNQSIDSRDAEGAINIDSRGGTFDGDIRGSLANVDILRISTGTTTLTHDVLQNYSVRVNPGATLNFDGDLTVEGDIHGRGTFGFDISNTQTITGDLNLRVGSDVVVSDTSEIGGIGDEYTLATVGGTLTNNATLSDTSALLDFDFVAGSDLVVEAVAAGGATAKSIGYSSAATQSFGETVLGAFAEGDLNGTSTFSNLASLSDLTSVGNALETLAPDFNNSVAKNIFGAVQNGQVQIDQRLNDLDCNHFYDARETSSLNTSGTQDCQSFAQTGSWTHVATPHATQGSLSFSAPVNFTDSSDNVSATYGYDQVVDDNTVVGLSGGYTRTEANNDAFSVSSTDLDIVQFSAYAGHRIGNANLVSKASFSSGDAETRRQSFEVIQADVGFRSFNAESVASYDVGLGKGVYLKPEAGFHYDNLTTDAFTEAGGLNLDVSKTSSNVLDARAGLTLGARRQVSDSLRADVYVTGAVVDDIYGKRDDLDFSFAGQSGSLASRQLNNLAVQGLAGVNLLSSDKFSFGAAVNSEFSGTETAVGTSVRTKLTW